MEYKKKPEVDLNRSRGLFFEIGLTVSLAAVLGSFSYYVTERTVSSLGEVVVMEEVEMEIPPSRQEYTPPPPPPPPTLTIVEDNVEIEEVEMQTTEVQEDTRIDVPTTVVVEPERNVKIVEPEIFTIVEEMPSFPGGDAKLFEYLRKNIKYPPMARENNLQGTVVLSFIVDEKGSIKDIKVMRSVGGGCDEEAIRVVKSMPQWNPGKQRGTAVKVSYTLPVRFTLKN